MLVVNPNHRLKTDLAAVEPPLWAGLIASQYEGDEILDAEALDLTIEQTVAEAVKSYHQNIVLVVMGNNPSVSSTPKMVIAEELAMRLFNKGKSPLFAGLHPNAVGTRFEPSKKDACFHIMRTPFLDFPMMPWDKLPMHLYRAHNWHCLDGSPRSPYASIYTSFGCPFDCYYCNIHALYGDRQVRFRPIKDVLREVDILVSQYQVRNIKIWDELFALKEDRVLSICSGLKDYDLNIWAYARLDTVTEKMLKAMKQGGINWLAYGFESVTDPKFTAKTEEVIKMTRDAGINIMANFMFGLPGTTQDDDQASLEFAMRHLFEFVNFYEARPYPGSKWYNDVNPVLSWEQYDQYGSNRMPFREKAFKGYFTNPEYLSMIKKKFGEQGATQIKEMLEDKINA
mgnify:CR=1 FL=1